MMWVAKPNLTNNNGIKNFEKKLDAVKYLTEVTGHEMKWENLVDKKGNKYRYYDWELVGKLYKLYEGK